MGGLFPGWERRLWKIDLPGPTGSVEVISFTMQVRQFDHVSFRPKVLHERVQAVLAKPSRTPGKDTRFVNHGIFLEATAS